MFVPLMIRDLTSSKCTHGASVASSVFPAAKKARLSRRNVPRDMEPLQHRAPLGTKKVFQDRGEERCDNKYRPPSFFDASRYLETQSSIISQLGDRLSAVQIFLRFSFFLDVLSVPLE